MYVWASPIANLGLHIQVRLIVGCWNSLLATSSRSRLRSTEPPGRRVLCSLSSGVRWTESEADLLPLFKIKFRNVRNKHCWHGDTRGSITGERFCMSPATSRSVLGPIHSFRSLSDDVFPRTKFSERHVCWMRSLRMRGCMYFCLLFHFLFGKPPLQFAKNMSRRIMCS